jgi:hypothetical protein
MENAPGLELVGTKDDVDTILKYPYLLVGEKEGDGEGIRG